MFHPTIFGVSCAFPPCKGYEGLIDLCMWEAVEIVNRPGIANGQAKSSDHRHEDNPETSVYLLAGQVTEISPPLILVDLFHSISCAPHVMVVFRGNIFNITIIHYNHHVLRQLSTTVLISSMFAGRGS